MECPYVRNVIFSKIKVDPAYDETLFTFSPKSIFDLNEVDESESGEISDCYESNMRKMQEYVIKSKHTALPDCPSNSKKNPLP